MGLRLPSERFRDMWRALGATRDGDDTLNRLRAAYDEPSRAYHTSLHIAACLALLDDPEVAALAARPAEVEAALWFHDVVYDTHARDNEERSAALAREVLVDAGAPREVAERIAEHVLATRDHAPRSADGALVIDVDLSILGADSATYARFEDDVRREYAWVDDDAFAEGRVAVLRRFLARPFLYATALFRDRLEAIARVNIAAAIDRLTRPR